MGNHSRFFYGILNDFYIFMKLIFLPKNSRFVHLSTIVSAANSRAVVI